MRGLGGTERHRNATRLSGREGGPRVCHPHHPISYVCNLLDDRLKLSRVDSQKYRTRILPGCCATEPQPPDLLNQACVFRTPFFFEAGGGGAKRSHRDSALYLLLTGNGHRACVTSAETADAEERQYCASGGLVGWTDR